MVATEGVVLGVVSAAVVAFAAEGTAVLVAVAEVVALGSSVYGSSFNVLQ